MTTQNENLLPLTQLVVREGYHDKIAPDYEYFCNWNRSSAETQKMLNSINSNVERVNKALEEAGCIFIPKDKTMDVYNYVNYAVGYKELKNDFLHVHLFYLTGLGLEFKGDLYNKYMQYKPYHEKFSHQIDREDSNRGRGYGTSWDIKVGFKTAEITSQSSMQQHSWSETTHYELSLKKGWIKVRK